MSDHIKELLDRLADYHAQRDLVQMEKQKRVEEIMTPEIKERLQDVEAEFSAQVEAADRNIEELTERIKIMVASEGKTVKGSVFQAVYAKGRVTWDTKKLEGLMMIVPDLKTAMVVGQSSVSLRKVQA